ncbi:MAG: phosphatidylserine decarboxylase family protein, partial [Spartobacteria bacterium]|nr:phosphatidylserine decarboxylase family protein [Spartobacteria bacterium]
HVNRTPIAGFVKHLSYTPGKHLLTYLNAASEYNEHSSVLIEGERINCLVHQIVGPIVRRVVYWLEPEQEVAKGELFGMMKFGSRLDIYLPADRVDVCIKPGDPVQAGLTIVARIKPQGDGA